MALLRKRQYPAAAGIAVLAILFLASSFSSVQALTVSGRAYAVYVNLPSNGINDTYYVDTGWLPANGGSANEAAAAISVVGVLDTGPAGSRSDGDECRGDSNVDISNGVILAGHPAEITFGHIGGRDDDECCDDDDAPIAYTIESLTFGGQPVTVTGEFDQVVSIVGVGDLTINWRRHGGGDDDDCEDDDYSVTALHLVLDSGGEVIVGGAYFNSDDECCVVPTETSTWSKVKALYRN
jgi:hypothetical protein